MSKALKRGMLHYINFLKHFYEYLTEKLKAFDMINLQYEVRIW